jgi:peptidoglycan/xylan/chitin deacetylase (PgdA/CDA1 family)
MVDNVRDHLHLTYKLDAGWTLSTTAAVVVATRKDLPRRLGRGKVQKLPYFIRHANGVTQYEYDITLTDLGTASDEKIVIVARAEVRGTTVNNKGRPKTVELVAWAGGKHVGSMAYGVTYFAYKVRTCVTQPPPPPPPPPPGGGTLTGAVTITFDDGFLTQYTNAYPIMKRYGLAGNVAANGRAVAEGWSDYVSQANLQELSANGWSVVNHTWDHQDMTTLTDQEVVDEIVMNRSWIQQNGFRGAAVFVVPFHSWGTRELDFVKQYAAAARGYSAQQLRTPTQWTPQTDFLQSWPPVDVYRLIGDEPFAPGVDLATAQSELRVYLERARTEGKVVDVFFHQVESDRLADFESLVKLLAEYKSIVRTYDELFPTTAGAAAMIVRR